MIWQEGRTFESWLRNISVEGLQRPQVGSDPGVLGKGTGLERLHDFSKDTQLV